jgi:hypothetical protein
MLREGRWVRERSIEEDRAARRSPHYKFGYFLSVVCPSKLFLPNSAVEIFPPKKKEQRR